MAEHRLASARRRDRVTLRASQEAAREATVLAAGGVLWRGDPTSGLEVAVVHRPKYDDWSLPKGKVDPGEQLVVTACREVEEETGQPCAAGPVVGEQWYPVAAGPKYVRYWAMAAIGDGEFVPNGEVDALEWLAPHKAEGRLSYPHDRDLVARFAAFPQPTTTVLLVRHGSAGDKRQWDGADRLRPLDPAGERAAQRLRDIVSCYGIQRLVSAPPLRCVQTVQPAAERLGLTVETADELAKDGYSPMATLRWLDEQIAAAQPLLLCSQGEVIPDLLRRLGERSGLQLHSAPNRKGSVWALTFAQGKLAAADYDPDLSPPLPVD